MIRLGMLDFDTSHVVEFAKRLNHVKVPQDEWMGMVNGQGTPCPSGPLT